MNGMGPVPGVRGVVAGVVAVANSTAMFESGELTEKEYVSALVVGNALVEGHVTVEEGLRVLMGLWMNGTVHGVAAASAD